MSYHSGAGFVGRGAQEELLKSRSVSHPVSDTGIAYQVVQ